METSKKGTNLFNLLIIISGFSAEINTRPEIYPCKDTLYLYFGNTSISSSYISCELVSMFAKVKEDFDLAISGFSNDEYFVTFKIGDEDKYKSDKRYRFQELTDVVLEVKLLDAAPASELALLIEESLAFPNSSYFVFSKTKYSSALLPFSTVDGTYYYYIAKESNPDNPFILSLSIKQLIKLWQLYFIEGITPAEFDYLLEAITNNEYALSSALFISLKIVMNEVGISCVLTDNGFEFRENGKRRIFDFNSNNSAEKLMLSLLFPTVTEIK